MSPEGHKPSENDTLFIFAGIAGILLLSQFALTKRQRDSILERDNHHSQMRHHDESGGMAPMNEKRCKACNGQGCKLQVHHIETQRIGGEDVPENLITLYECEHNGKLANGEFVDPNTDFVVHPDMITTFKEYRKGNKNAFAEMFTKRSQTIAKGEAYWNTDHDQEMAETARERTKSATIKGWKFPWSK